MQGWQPLSLELRDGDYPDYLASNLGCRMCSERLRDILQSLASPSDKLQWLEVGVRKKDQDRRYFILHFPDPTAVLDTVQTIFAGGFVVKAVLASDAVVGHRVFGYPKCGCLPLFISEEVRQAILEAHCTGMEITRVPVA